MGVWGPGRMLWWVGGVLEDFLMYGRRGMFGVGGVWEEDVFLTLSLSAGKSHRASERLSQRRGQSSGPRAGPAGGDRVPTPVPRQVSRTQEERARSTVTSCLLWWREQEVRTLTRLTLLLPFLQLTLRSASKVRNRAFGVLRFVCRYWSYWWV